MILRKRNCFIPKKDKNGMQVCMGKKILVCLDGSKNSIKGLKVAISMATKMNACIIGIHSITKYEAFFKENTSKIPEKRWPKNAKKIIKDAKKLVTKNDIDFEGVVLIGHTAGHDLVTFANNNANKIDHIVIGARGMGFPKELFFGSTSNFVLHAAKAPVTIVK